jgi:hypothetical protein
MELELEISFRLVTHWLYPSNELEQALCNWPFLSYPQLPDLFEESL